jgi:hypothetical protein
MSQIIHHRALRDHRRRGVALLVVLMIVLAVTIISAGFIAQSDVELASGSNMLMHAQTDQLAHSGLEHAKGPLLRPQDVPLAQIHSTDWYWLGTASNRLLTDSQDYYDVTVARDATDYCTYAVTCEAYRKRASDGVRIGRTGLAAKLRLDPAITLWTRTNTTLRPKWTVQGDVCVEGTLTNQAPTASASSLDGDVFATQLVGTSVGQTYPVANLMSVLSWPPVNSTFLSTVNPTTTVSASPMSGTYSTTPRRIYKYTGNLTLGSGINAATIQGMLLVTGNLTVAVSGCSITTARNLPALYVGGDLLLDSASNLTVTGLAVVNGNLRIHSDAANVKFVGGLCLGGVITETTADASGNGLIGTLSGDPAWEASGALNGALQLDGVNDYVNCGNSTLFDLATGLTVAGWVKAAGVAATTQETLLVKSGAYALEIVSNTVRFSVYSNTATAWQVVQFPIDASFANVWHYVAGTFDGSAVTIYLDGALQGSTAYAGAIASQPANPLWLGSNGSNFYKGLLDDVRVYSRALSGVEIGQVAAGGSALDLVAHWPLNGPGSAVTIVSDPVRASICGYNNGVKVYWSPAVGAFFSGIKRQ